MAMQALILGFGGSGAQVLTYLKELTVFKYGALPETMKFLLFDTIADWQPGKTVTILGGKSEETVAIGRTDERSTWLNPTTEYFHLEGRTPSLKQYVNDILTNPDAAAEEPHLYDWLHAPWLNQNVANDKLNISEGAAQQRQIGRFALFQNVRFIVPEFSRRLNELQRNAGGASVNVWLVASAAGGTGAGCLLDAATLVRLAAGKNVQVRVSAVIVLPDVYQGLEGIRKGRAYSLLRELERLQRRGFRHEDRYREDGDTLVDLIARYDATGKYVAAIQNKVFDNVFLVGKYCRAGDERAAFFSSVVAAMDPYVDENSGPRQLEQAVNVDYDVVSFGASRLYLPMRTYEELFAWEQVRDWLSAVAAAHPTRAGYIQFGAEGDRRREAETKVRRLLPFFEDLLDLTDKARNERMAVARELDPRTLVTRRLQFASMATSGLQGSAAQLEDVVPLTYVNPFLSLRQPDESQVGETEILVKTYKENRKAKGPRETQEASRDRFVLELENASRRFRDSGGATGSFEMGRRAVADVVMTALLRRVDEIVGEDLTKGTFAVSEAFADQGTAFTRLHQELQWIITAQDGVLQRIDDTLTEFVSNLNEERNAIDREGTEAIAALREAQPSTFGSLMTWVEDYQVEARSRMTDVIRWHQRIQLLRLIQEVVGHIRARFRLWFNLLDDQLRDLVMTSESRTPAMLSVDNNIKRLSVRLQTLAKDRAALISLAPWDERDTEMQGFADELRREASASGDRSLAQRALDGGSWVVEFDGDRRPHLKLALELEEEGSVTLGRRDLERVHEFLQERFQRRIENVLKNKTIFDYLDFADRYRRMNAEEVVKRLDGAAAILLETNSPALARLVYKAPFDTAHRRIAESLDDKLHRHGGGNVKAGDPEDTHSDPYSITLLKTVMPNPDEIADLQECAEDYYEIQQERTTGKAEQDQPIRRAQVYHIYRAEQEAWHIERRLARLENRRLKEADRLPPRLVRLLDRPVRMKAFVDAVGTGAVAYDGENWIFHDTVANRDIVLAQSGSLMRAAVTFVLQETEDKPGALTEIDATRAQDSATEFAKRSEARKTDLVWDYVNSQAFDRLLNDHVRVEQRPGSPEHAANERLKQGLKRVFQFYGHPEARTGLDHRLEL